MNATILYRTFAAAALCVVALAGCNPDGVTDVTTDPSSTASDIRHQYHYDPSVQNVHWAPGCGVVRVDGTPCPVGLIVTYTPDYIDLQVTHTEHVDSAHHRVTITLDTWSNNTIHPLIAVRPIDLNLGTLDLQMLQTYEVAVVDRTHQTLWTGEIRPALAY
jgi:hypothetical protein